MTPDISAIAQKLENFLVHEKGCHWHEDVRPKMKCNCGLQDALDEIADSIEEATALRAQLNEEVLLSDMHKEERNEAFRQYDKSHCGSPCVLRHDGVLSVISSRRNRA